MTPDALLASLDSLDGWKRINKKAMLLFGGPKKSFPRWERATDKAVFAQHLLAEFEHEDIRYYLYAFSTSGVIAPDRLAELEAAAAGIDLGTVRYESTGYTCFEAWRGEEGSKAREDTDITSLGDPNAGLFVYPIADGGPFPLVAYGKVEGHPYIFPVDAKRL